MRKYISIVLVILAVIAGVYSFFFSSPRYQILDDIIVGTYFDTAYEAYLDSDGCSGFEVDEELATIDINNDFAVWIASTKTNEFIVLKMRLKNGQYCSLGNYIITKIKDCNSPELEREFTLGEEKWLHFTILPSSDFQKGENIKTKSFIFKNKSFVFAYRIVDNPY